MRPDGASLVPAHAVTAPGETFRERVADARVEMSRSEQVAAAVALRAGGLDVEATPRGVLVESVAVDVPAAGAVEDGDVIVAAAGRKTLTPDALRSAVSSVEPGETVRLRLRRDGKGLERVGAHGRRSRRRVARRSSASASTQDAKIELPLDVDIDLGDVGGPSAGLPFALQVYKELGNDVDRGYRVAATGEIELDGSVVSVGGIKQKTLRRPLVRSGRVPRPGWG